MIGRHALWGVDLAQMLPLLPKVLRHRRILIQINMIDGGFSRDLPRRGPNDTALDVDFGKLLLLEFNVLAQLLALARDRTARYWIASWRTHIRRRPST
jgi:hypothetical protein